MAISKSEDPPCRPYRAPKLTDQPRVPAAIVHKAAREKWITYSEQSRRTVLPLVRRWSLVFKILPCNRSVPCLPPILAHPGNVRGTRAASGSSFFRTSRRNYGVCWRIFILPPDCGVKATRKGPENAQPQLRSALAPENFDSREKAKKGAAMANAAEDQKYGRDHTRKGMLLKGAKNGQLSRTNGHPRRDRSRDEQANQNNRIRDEKNTRRGEASPPRNLSRPNRNAIKKRKLWPATKPRRKQAPETATSHTIFAGWIAIRPSPFRVHPPLKS